MKVNNMVCNTPYEGSIEVNIIIIVVRSLSNNGKTPNTTYCNHIINKKRTKGVCTEGTIPL